MKLKKGLIISEIDGSFIAVAADDAGKAFNGMLKLNSTAAFIAELLRAESSPQTLTQAVQTHYNISYNLASESVQTVLSSFRKVGIIDE